MATVDISDQEIINSVLDRIYIYEEAVDFVKTHHNDDWMVQFSAENPRYKEDLDRVLNPDLSNVFAPFTTMIAVKAVFNGVLYNRTIKIPDVLYGKIAQFNDKL